MSLMPRLVLGDLDLTSYPFGVEWGRDYGSPQNVVETLISSLSAGDVLSRTRVENREITFTVLVQGASLAELAELEAQLVAECDKDRNTLLADPGDFFGAASVFETFVAQATLVFDDDGEIGLLRRYELTIPALPHVRDELPTISPAVPFATGVVVDDGTSTTNWSATFPAGASVSVVSGAVTVTYDPSVPSGVYGAGGRRVFPTPIDTSANRYVAVDWKSSVASYHGFIPNATPFGNLSEVRRDPLAGGLVRSYYQLPASVASLSEISFDVVHPARPAGSATLTVDQIQVMQALPAIGTGRQLLRTIEVGGSVPTQGTIEVTHPSSGLGEVIVYSYESQGGYQPALSPHRTLPLAGVDYTADPTGISGGIWAMSTLVRWNVPVTALPSGEAFLVLRLHNSLAGTCTFDWSAFSEMGGSVLGVVSGQFTHTFATANVPETVVMPVPLNLPTVPMGPSGNVSLDVRRIGSAGPGTSYLHEGWLFSTKGSLSMVGAGTRKRLSIIAPSLEHAQGAMLCGDNADGSDAYSVSATSTSRQHHVLKPGANNVFTVTTGAENAAVAAEHYNRHHTHAVVAT